MGTLNLSPGLAVGLTSVSPSQVAPLLTQAEPGRFP